LERAKANLKVFLSMQIKLAKNRYSYNTEFFFHRIHHLFVQKAKDPLERAILDGCQLALKVCYVCFYFLEKSRLQTPCIMILFNGLCFR
jgi:hypothetical protein